MQPIVTTSVSLPYDRNNSRSVGEKESHGRRETYYILGGDVCQKVPRLCSLVLLIRAVCK
jgi:hypothetical protein